MPGVLPDLHLPAPRASDLNYETASWIEVMRELMKIKSMWFGLMSLTISGFLLGALGVWGIEYFKRSFELSATKAGALTPVIGPARRSGIVGGGELADWLLQPRRHSTPACT